MSHCVLKMATVSVTPDQADKICRSLTEIDESQMKCGWRHKAEEFPGNTLVEKSYNCLQSYMVEFNTCIEVYKKYTVKSDGPVYMP